MTSGVDAGHLFGVLERVRLDRGAVVLESARRALDERRFASPAAMISRAIAFASAMSDPTSSPSHASAHAAELVRRGSMAYSRAPRRIPFSTW